MPACSSPKSPPQGIPYQGQLTPALPTSSATRSLDTNISSLQPAPTDAALMLKTLLLHTLNSPSRSLCQPARPSSSLANSAVLVGLFDPASAAVPSTLLASLSCPTHLHCSPASAACYHQLCSATTYTTHLLTPFILRIHHHQSKSDLYKPTNNPLEQMQGRAWPNKTK